MKKKCSIVLLFLLWSIQCTAEESYSLVDLYRIALTTSEKLQSAQADADIAGLTRQKAFSALVPKFSLYGNYSRMFDVSGNNPDWTNPWGVTVFQNFSLSGREVTAYKVSEEDRKQRMYELLGLKSEVLFQVATDFYNVLKSKKSYEIVKADVTRLEKHRESVMAQLKLETVTKLDLYRVEAELSQAKTNLLNALGMFTLAQSILTNQLCLPEPYSLIQPVHTPPIPTSPETLSILKQDALNERSEFKALASEKKIMESMITWNEGAFWPEGSIEGGYQYIDGGPDSFFEDHDNFQIALKFNFLFYDGGYRKTIVSESMMMLYKLKLREKELRKGVSIEVEQAYLDSIRQQNLLLSLVDQLKYVQENYDAVTRQFQYGLANSVDVMEANTLLSNTERQLSEVQYDFQLALLNISKAKGTLSSEIDALLEK
ncbi:MAG: TolC family protein [Desulfobacterales bacterium]|nr:TolC family protein [Desulfobacterales bacterium]